jgi:hypothetical protein
MVTIKGGGELLLEVVKFSWPRFMAKRRPAVKVSGNTLAPGQRQAGYRRVWHLS